MDKNKLFELFEKTYFHEMEIRQKMAGRVQINFALVITAFAALSYMTRMIDFSKNHPVIGMFILCVITCILLSLICLYYLVKAFWNNVYKGMPTASEIDIYRSNLLLHKKEIDDYNTKYPTKKQSTVNVDESLSDYIYKQLVECSSAYSIVNSERSSNIHYSFKWILYASIPFFLASVLFIILDLDVSSPRKETPILNISLNKQLKDLNSTLESFKKPILNLHGEKMSDNKAPPPPSAPEQPEPRREINHDRPQKQM